MAEVKNKKPGAKKVVASKSTPKPGAKKAATSKDPKAGLVYIVINRNKNEVIWKLKDKKKPKDLTFKSQKEAVEHFKTSYRWTKALVQGQHGKWAFSVMIKEKKQITTEVFKPKPVSGPVKEKKPAPKKPVTSKDPKAGLVYIVINRNKNEVIWKLKDKKKPKDLTFKSQKEAVEHFKTSYRWTKALVQGQHGKWAFSVMIKEKKQITTEVFKPKPVVKKPVVKKPVVKKPVVKKPVVSKVKPTAANGLPKKVFDIKVNTQAIFDTIMSERASRRQGTHKVKNKGEVSGTGKKPWAQKGTGRARAASLRSNVFVGGGVAFGPTPERNYNLKVNKKVRKLALFSALTLKAKDKAILIKEIQLTEIKTKALIEQLSKLHLNDKKVLIVTEDEKTFKSASNLKKVNTVKFNSLSIEAIIHADYLIITNNDIKKLEGMVR